MYEFYISTTNLLTLSFLNYLHFIYRFNENQLYDMDQRMKGYVQLGFFVVAAVWGFWLFLGSMELGLRSLDLILDRCLTLVGL